MRLLSGLRRHTTARLYRWLSGVLTENSTALLQISERQLSELYAQRRHLGMAWPALHETGYRLYSESDEDGILHFLFSVIGTTKRFLIDIGAGGIVNSNTRNLLANHGWHGLLIDAHPQLAAQLRDFYGGQPLTRLMPPTSLATFVTPDNVNDLLRPHVPPDVDLLCIDIDGLDYWVWRAIDVVRPRVVVVEYQCLLGADRCVAVRNHPEFRPVWRDGYLLYSSASLAGFVKLGKQKGYRLVGCQQYGYNAFFVRDDVVNGLPEASIDRCLALPLPQRARRRFGDEVSRYDWVDV